MADRERLHRRVDTPARDSRRAERPERTPAVHPALDLQRRVGNRAALVALGAQTALQVGAADDPFERAADAAAAQVVASLRSGGATVGAPSPDGELDAGPPLRRTVRRAPAPAPVVGREGGPVDAELEASLQSARSGGAPLAEPVRRQMEGAFGADFAGVRVHQGAQSKALNDQLGARAFTLGSDIFFSSSVPDASSPEGAHLMAHELAHTVQQAGGIGRRVVRRPNQD